MNILFILVLTLLGGCASYTCNEYPSGRCQSVSEVYEKTNRRGGQATKTEIDKINSREEIKKGNEAIHTPLLGNPILKEPIVLRVLLNSWEDEDQDFIMGGYIFVKVKDAQWRIP